MNNVFDYVELSQGYSIYEIPPLTKWIGKSIKDLDIRQRYKISVISTKEEGSLNMLPGPDHIISGSEHLVVIGLQKDIDHILEQLR